MSSKQPFKQNKKKVVKAPNYKAIGASIDRVKEISYNEHDRKDYLTGFHRRKVARREYAQKKIEEKEKREKAEQKKFVKLQREAFQQSIIDSRKKHENEFGIKDENDDEEEEEEEIKEEETIDEKGNKVKVLIKPSTIQETQIKEYSSEDKIITTTVKPLSFNSDGEDEDESDDDNNNNNEDSEDEQQQDDDEEEEVNDKSKVKKKLPNLKKESTTTTNKFNSNNKKDTITADGLTLIDAEKKIYQDEKGRRIKMIKEKGKIIPVVLSAAAETAIEKGWKLPRSLRTSQKKSWSHAVQKKSKKKQRKEKKGK
ncbi:hypothetical protein ACTFIZ_008859 [Dictyostelium cf. discoideum]